MASEITYNNFEITRRIYAKYHYKIMLLPILISKIKPREILSHQSREIKYQ